MTLDSGRVLVAGASGGTGRQILDVLSRTDFVPIALTREEGNAGALSAAGAREVRVGDLLDPFDAEHAVDGVDAVLCAVGTSAVTGMLFGDIVDGTGVCNLADAAGDAGVEHVVLESSIGVGNSADAMPRSFRMLLSRVLSAKEEGERCVRESGVPYTVVRPGGLTDDDPAGVVVGEGGTGVSGSVSRADVARVMVASLTTPAAANRTFEVVGRDGVRGEATGTEDVDWQLPPSVEW